MLELSCNQQKIDNKPIISGLTVMVVFVIGRPTQTFIIGRCFFVQKMFVSPENEDQRESIYQ